MKRFIGFLLALVIGFSTVSLNTVSVEAKETVVFEVSSNSNCTNKEDTILENKNAFTEAVKFLIKNIIKHGKECAEIIAKVSDKKTAKQFLKYHKGIAGALTPLLEYSEIPKQAVADAVFRGVINSGGSRVVASRIATAVKAAWDWFLF